MKKDKEHKDKAFISSFSETITMSYLVHMILPKRLMEVRTNVYSPICSGEYNLVIIGETQMIINCARNEPDVKYRKERKKEDLMKEEFIIKYNEKKQVPPRENKNQASTIKNHSSMRNILSPLSWSSKSNHFILYMIRNQILGNGR